MKLEVRNKKKSAAPSVKTVGIKKKASSPSVKTVGIKKKASSPSVKTVGIKKKASSPSVKTVGIKKKASSPSVKTVGIKKKASAPSGVAKKVKKATTTEKVKKAITKEVEVKKVKKANPSPGGKKKAAVGSAAKVDNKKKANKKANVASGKTKETAGDAVSMGKAGIKRKQEVKENSSVDVGEKKKVRRRIQPGKKGNMAGPNLINLQGKLSEIFWNRSLEVKARTLIVAMKNFTVDQSSDPVFESAHRIQTNKLKKIIFLEYKTKAEAKEMKIVLQKNNLIKYAKFMNRVSKELKRPDVILVHPKRLYIGNVPSEVRAADLKMKFPTALSVIVTHSKGKAKLIFKTRKDAREAFEASSSVWFNGVKLTVLYLVPQRKPGGTKKKSTKKNTEGPAKKNVKRNDTSPKKKMKTQTKQ
ncbi:axoneme-associated protein mst101(2)-like [Penaeus chinensis]|uniref:axoneme-associated protein mst101(2)-like n=1 Tax=Penaeus chinensis TaxID=139456 RepID=UPI001FB70600|nr:axoneme-associated protein mst101(2)-like [Penaeus chinensis]